MEVVSDLEAVSDLEVVSNLEVVSSDLKVEFSDLEVVSDLEAVTCVMQVVACMILHLAVVVLSPAGWTTHVFTVVVFVPPRSIGA